MRTSTSGFVNIAFIAGWGATGDTPVMGRDYDGDGKADPTVFRPSTGTWYILSSSSSYSTGASYAWGEPGDVPLTGDYDRDGVSDLTVYRPWTGEWFSLNSSAGFSSSYQQFQWLVPGDWPVMGDYDGDGVMDVAVIHGETWVALLSGAYDTTMREIDWPGWPEPDLSAEPSALGSDTFALPPLVIPPLIDPPTSDRSMRIDAMAIQPLADPSATDHDGGASSSPLAEAASTPMLTSVTMIVDVTGTAGAATTPSVTNDATAMTCTGMRTTCSGTFTDGTAVKFTAHPASGASLVGWPPGFCDTFTATDCTVTAHDGRLIVAAFAAPVSTIQYYHLDVLGSVRAVTDYAGATVERHDYKPFGEDTQTLPPPGTDPTRFIGVERDQTGLDYMGARYYSMFAGRFTSVDPVNTGEAITNPQEWNRYAYALNNPLRYSDPGGMHAGPGGEGCDPSGCNGSWNGGNLALESDNGLSSGYDDIVTAMGGDPNRPNGSTPQQPPPDDGSDDDSGQPGPTGPPRGHHHAGSCSADGGGENDNSGENDESGVGGDDDSAASGAELWGAVPADVKKAIIADFAKGGGPEGQPKQEYGGAWGNTGGPISAPAGPQGWVCDDPNGFHIQLEGVINTARDVNGGYLGDWHIHPPGSGTCTYPGPLQGDFDAAANADRIGKNDSAIHIAGYTDANKNQMIAFYGPSGVIATYNLTTGK